MSAPPDRWSDWLTERRDAGDEAQRRITLSRLTQIRDQVLAGAGTLDGLTVLDVGCGDGLLGLAALERVGADGTVVFTDISPALLEHAARAARKLGLAARADFVVTRAERLDGIADNSVDVVTARSVLIYVADKAAAFAAMYRVLRPGGCLSLFEPINKLMYPEPGNRMWGYDVTAVENLAKRVKREYRHRSDPATSTMLDFDAPDLVRYATEAGFPESHLTLKLDIVPGEMRAASFDSLLDAAPNPLAPTLRESIDHALDASERRQFVDHLHKMFTTTQPTRLWAGAYVTARSGETANRPDPRCPPAGARC